MVVMKRKNGRGCHRFLGPPPLFFCIAFFRSSLPLPSPSLLRPGARSRECDRRRPLRRRSPATRWCKQKRLAGASSVHWHTGGARDKVRGRVRRGQEEGSREWAASDHWGGCASWDDLMSGPPSAGRVATAPPPQVLGMTCMRVPAAGRGASRPAPFGLLLEPTGPMQPRLFQ
jgi:hypothetical protein